MNRTLTHVRSKFRNLEPVWRWNNRHARRLFRQWARDSEDDIFPYPHQMIADALHKGGIFVTDIERLYSRAWSLNSPERELSGLQAYAMNASPTASTNRIKPFNIEIYQRGVGYELNLQHPLTRFHLQENILMPVALYLGLWPRFNTQLCTATKIMDPGQQPVWSQRWHRDPEDKRLVKVFMYLTDVLDDGAGPFCYVRGSQNGGPLAGIFPQKLPPYGSYPDNAAFQRIDNMSDHIETCYGKAGTIIFADTTGLHRGGYSTTQQRIMTTGVYVTDGKFKNGKSEYGRIVGDIADANLDMIKYALNERL